MGTTIFTIGYGNRSIGAFIQILQKYDIDILIDIRTTPFSRWNPDFSSQKLEIHLINYNIRYLFLGKELGGKPSNPDCYMDDSINYQIVQSKQFFKDGINVVADINKQGTRIMLMCSEQSPLACHRKLMVGDYLQENGFEIHHIDKDGNILNQLF